MLFILLFIPGDYAGPVLSSGRRLAIAGARRRCELPGGHLHQIADIGSDLMKTVFKTAKEDDASEIPGVIADCTGDNVRLISVGPLGALVD